MKEHTKMPRGDGTGPMGMGGMTGRGAGYCAGFGAQGRENTARGRGLGIGFLGGHGYRNRGFGGGRRGWWNRLFALDPPGWMHFGGCAAPNRYQTTDQKPDPEMETQVLQNQAKILRERLDSIEKRLAEIKTGTAEQQT
jgi:hypothetical protein